MASPLANLFKCRFGSYVVKRLVAALTLFFVFSSSGSWGHDLFAQNQSISGGPNTNSIIMPVQQRPQPSPLERRNLKNRPEDDNDSIAKLVQNLQSADVMTEVVVGRSRLITLNEPLVAAGQRGTPVVAVGDPTVLEFDVLPSSKMIRILGRRVGVTDLSVITASGKAYTFEVRVVYDLNVLRAYIKQLFPNARLKIVQVYEHVVVEGEASSVDQSAKIMKTIKAFIDSAQVPRSVKSTTTTGIPTAAPNQGNNRDQTPGDQPPQPVQRDSGQKPDVTATFQAPRVINLIRVPGVQQVMLKVTIAEVDRSALREMGTNWLYRDSKGRTFGVNRGSSAPVSGQMNPSNLLGLALGSSTTAFAILPNTFLAATIEALRTNQVISILAEPNLMAMHGQKASFLAGGEFPVPVPQSLGAAGGTTFTVEFKEFGVLLDFIPYIMDNGSIRLHVAPEVSTIDQTIGVTTAGIQIPGVNTRRANTTVELKQGQTLALAGLIQVELDATTARIPGLGDLPYIGSLFTNNSHERVEKELVILVSPHLVSGMESHQVGPLPGCEIKDPDDHEFYLLNRIEGRHPAKNYRATNGWDNPLQIPRKPARNTPRQFIGPYGFSR